MTAEALAREIVGAPLAYSETLAKARSTPLPPVLKRVRSRHELVQTVLRAKRGEPTAATLENPPPETINFDAYGRYAMKDTAGANALFERLEGFGFMWPMMMIRMHSAKRSFIATARKNGATEADIVSITQAINFMISDLVQLAAAMPFAYLAAGPNSPRIEVTNYISSLSWHTDQGAGRRVVRTFAGPSTEYARDEKGTDRAFSPNGSTTMHTADKDGEHGGGAYHQAPAMPYAGYRVAVTFWVY